MNDQLKETVSLFIKVSSDNISDSTRIDRDAVGSSIVLHRMFAKLADSGFNVQDYHLIKTFGDLNRQVNGERSEFPAIISNISNAADFEIKSRPGTSTVGIDMEEISNMPIADDFREHTFYQLNFSTSEISYCILKKSPYASFAGLFAAKEAICKADSRLIEMPFNQIEIQHDNNGKPFFRDFSISISHSELTAVAMVIFIGLSDQSLDSTQFVKTENSNTALHHKYILVLWLAALALFTSIVALALLLFRAKL